MILVHPYPKVLMVLLCFDFAPKDNFLGDKFHVGSHPDRPDHARCRLIRNRIPCPQVDQLTAWSTEEIGSGRGNVSLCVPIGVERISVMCALQRETAETL